MCAFERAAGSNRVAIVGLPESGQSTFAFHLLRTFMRYGIRAAGLDQTRPQSFKKFWEKSHIAYSKSGGWCSVKQVRNAKDICKVTEPNLVIDVGVGEENRKNCIKQASLLIFVVGNRNTADEIKELIATARAADPTIPRMLIAARVCGHATDVSAESLEWMGKALDASAVFRVPYFEGMASAISCGEDVWVFRRDIPPSPEHVGCRSAMKTALTAVIAAMEELGLRNIDLDRPSNARLYVLSPRPRSEGRLIGTNPRNRHASAGLDDNSSPGFHNGLPELILLNPAEEFDFDPYESGMQAGLLPPLPTIGARTHSTRGPNAIRKTWRWVQRSADFDADTNQALLRVMETLEFDVTGTIGFVLHMAPSYLHANSFRSFGVPVPPAGRGRGFQPHSFKIGEKLDGHWNLLAKETLSALVGKPVSKTQALRWAIRLMDHLLHEVWPALERSPESSNANHH